MTTVLSREEFNAGKELLLRELKHSVFIYPTDTIYGIGCNALDKELVQRIRDIKCRHHLPFSVIAPSKAWIRQRCIITKEGESWLAKLPGPYTLILRLKDNAELPEPLNVGLGTLGVRIPKHWFSDVVAQLGIPIVTTSANLTGENYMTSLEDLDLAIRKHMDHIIYDGELQGTPSTIVRLDTDRIDLTERGR
jgi:tRNA threonylcarbamoyl adenosine modification protein (Sua5/YciO/YrdC/YwlC family)